MTKMCSKLSVAIVPLLLSFTAPAFAQDGGPSGAFSFSSDSATAATQRQVKQVIERYQAGLNAGDFAAIRSLFAPDAVSEWNDKRTLTSVDAMAPAYEALFKTTKFTTDFQYDAVDIHGDIAIVRTHHPVGQTELSKQGGKKTFDFNREIFVLKRQGADWKVILYTFSTQPKQGEQ